MNYAIRDEIYTVMRSVAGALRSIARATDFLDLRAYLNFNEILIQLLSRNRSSSFRFAFVSRQYISRAFRARFQLAGIHVRIYFCT